MSPIYNVCTYDEDRVPEFKQLLQKQSLYYRYSIASWSIL